MTGAPSLQVPGDVPANVVSAQETTNLMTTPLPDDSASASSAPAGDQAQGPHLTTTMKESARSLWHGFKVVAKTAEGLVDGTPFKMPIAALNKLIEIADAVIDNKESVATLLLPIGQRLEVVSKEMMGKELPRDLNLNCERFASTLKGATEELQKIHEQGLLKRMLELQENPKEIQDIIRQVDEATKNFQLELNLANLRQTNIIKDNTEILRLNNLGPIHDVRYARLEHDSCAPGTRTDIIKDIISWCMDSSPGVPGIYWLSGMAGTGKSTIAYTICKQLASDQKASRLGASFFCSRQSLAGRNRRNIIPTIAHELALQLPHFRRALLDSIVDANPPQLQDHINSLLIEPWNASIGDRAQLPPLVVVVDALDEVENGGGSEFLKELMNTIEKDRDHINGLKFFVTSRRDPGIEQLDLEKFLKPSGVCRLENVPKATANEDIYRYLYFSLPELPALEVRHLADQAGVLFIYAATAVRYILPESEKMEGTPDNVQEDRMQTLLNSWPDKSHRGADGLRVDHLYEGILQEYLGQKAEIDRGDHLSILQMILCAEEPILVSDIPKLVNKTRIKEGNVMAVLRALHSVLYLSSDRVFTYHKSFVDFMFNPSRFMNQELAGISCPTPAVHVHLATSCFRLMDLLQFNICELPSSFLNDSEMQDLPIHVDNKISSALHYACRHWAAHLLKMSTVEQETIKDIIDMVQKWLNQRLLFWMEAMNLIKLIHECYPALMAAHRWLGMIIIQAETKDLIAKDLISARTLATFFATHVIAAATPHLYLSALAASSRDSTLMNHWRKRFPGIPTVIALLNTVTPWAVLQHDSAVNSVSFSQDGLYVISGSGVTVLIWEVATGRQLHQLDGHKHLVTSVGFSPDGLHAISGSHDKTVRMWDVSTGMQLHQLDGHKHWVNSVSFSHNGLHAISGSADKTVCIWDVSTGKQLHQLDGHKGGVNSVGFSPDGLHAISGSADNTVRIWDVSMGKQLHQLDGHKHWVESVGFSPDGLHAVSGSFDKTVHIWDVSMGKQLHQLDGHKDFVNSVSFSWDGLHVISGSNDKTVRIWDMSTGKQLHQLDGHESWVRSVSFSQDGLHAISGSNDKTVRIWDMSRGKQLLKLDGHESDVTSVGFSQDGLHAISGSEDKTVCIWDMSTEKQLHQLNGHEGWVTSVCFSQDGLHAISGSSDKTVRIWDVSMGKQLHQLDGHEDWVRSVGFSQDGLHAISGSSDKTVRIWDASTGKQLHQLDGHENWVRSVGFSQDGLHAISGSDDKTVRIWDMSTGKQLLKLDGHESDVTSVSFSQDGLHAISGSEDKTVRIWDVSTGKQLCQLDGHEDWVRSVGFSQDGLHAISGSYDKTVRIWDVFTGKQLHQLNGHEDWVNSVGFSQDGLHAISGSGDKTVRIWTLPQPGTSDPWHVDTNGWIISSNNQRYMWLPSDMHRFLRSPQKLVISSEGSVKVDFTNAWMGTEWAKCFDRSS